MKDWSAHHRLGLEHALQSLRRHNRRRKRFKWGADMRRGVPTTFGRFLFWAQQLPWYDPQLPIEPLLTPDRVEAFVLHLEECGNKPATI